MYHVENFLSIRNISRTRRGGSGRYVPESASGRLELSYRDALAEANSCYFDGEFTKALDKYLELRQLILVQSHPELPLTGFWGLGTLVAVDFAAVDPDRVFALSRSHLAAAPADRPPEPAAVLEHVVKPGEFRADPRFAKFAELGVRNPAGTAGPQRSATELVAEARRPENAASPERSAEILTRAREAALAEGNTRLAAEISGETGAALLASDNVFEEDLIRARGHFSMAESLFTRSGDTVGATAMRSNLAVLDRASTARTPAAPGPSVTAGPMMAPRPMVQPGARIVTDRAAPDVVADTGLGLRRGATAAPRRLVDASEIQLVVDNRLTTADRVATPDRAPAAPRTVGLLTSEGVRTVSLNADAFTTQLRDNLYATRVNATTLDALRFWEENETNFVAYIPHLFFYVLPVAIGDTLDQLGRFEAAAKEYADATRYSYINRNIEGRDLWLRLARATVAWGDRLFRDERDQEAKAIYERIVLTDFGVPSGPLYDPAVFQPMRAIAREAINRLQNRTFAPHNPQVFLVISRAHMQLRKIANGLTYLGVGRDDVPVFRFRYLQSAATYLADTAIQAERTFINFKSTAEREKIERLQMEAAVELHKTAVRIEQKKLIDANLERDAARENRQFADLRISHADQTLNDWNTLGWELANVNAALAWASNAANDQDIRYYGVRYDGKSHNFDTDVPDFYDVVGEWRENLNFEIQQRRLQRQAAEARAEADVARVREAQAGVRYEIQQLQLEMARARRDSAQEVLDYASDRQFNEDMWFRLAEAMRDLAGSYLDDAIYAALLMERAYDLEFDRDLNRIREHYGVAAADGLLGGDLLKRDIDSFTVDYLKHAQKNNPIREVISLRREFPAQFQIFLDQGILPFRTDLEIFDRRIPGAYRRKIKRIELFVEGLVPDGGAHGTLLHHGFSSEWRLEGGNWIKKLRVTPPQRMLLSSHQLRRDLAIFQPSEQTLALFENLGPQGNWTLEMNRSANNLDFQAISDIKLVMYFDADYSASLRAHLPNVYPNDGGGVLIVSSRFHFPDQYFRLDQDRQAAFQIHPSRLAYNQENHTLRGFAVSVVDNAGAGIAGVALTVSRASDSASVAATTDASGKVTGDPATMAPFGAWRGASPAGTFTVAFADGVAVDQIGDVHLSLDYAFTYRADGTFPA